MNRRIRNRTYGGVRGRGTKVPLLLDPAGVGAFNGAGGYLRAVCFFFFAAFPAAPFALPLGLRLRANADDGSRGAALRAAGGLVSEADTV